MCNTDTRERHMPKRRKQVSCLDALADPLLPEFRQMALRLMARVTLISEFRGHPSTLSCPHRCGSGKAFAVMHGLRHAAARSQPILRRLPMPGNRTCDPIHPCDRRGRSNRKARRSRSHWRQTIYADRRRLPSGRAETVERATPTNPGAGWSSVPTLSEASNRG